MSYHQLGVQKTRGATVDASGNAYIAGIFSDTADFDPGPRTYNLTSAGYSDVFISKLDSAGNFVWARRVGGSLDDDYAYGVTVDASGDLYTVGEFHGTVTFDPGPATYNLTSAGGFDVFISKLDSAGNFVWARRVGGTSDDIAYGVTVDASGNVYTVGWLNGTADFDPGPDTYNLTVLGNNDAYVLKLGSCGNFVGQSSYGILLFPPLCTRDASGLTQDVYSSRSLGLFRGTNDRFFLSSKGEQFAPLVVDDAVHVNGVDSGLGPYNLQPGVPPFILNVPVDENLEPLPARDITSLLPAGRSPVLFELRDTERVIYGNTAVYLVTDCGIYLGKTSASINFVTHDDEVAGMRPEFDVRFGLLSQLRTDRDFSRASCLGHFYNTPANASLPNPLDIMD